MLIINGCDGEALRAVLEDALTQRGIAVEEQPRPDGTVAMFAQWRGQTLGIGYRKGDAGQRVAALHGLWRTIRDLERKQVH